MTPTIPKTATTGPTETPKTTTGSVPAPSVPPARSRVTTAQSLGLYGESGTYKTTQLGSVAEYIFSKTGKRLRLVSAEAGQSETVLAPYIEQGIIEPWWLTNNNRSAIIKILRGEWPTVKLVNGHPKAVWEPTPAAEWTKVGGYAFEGLTTIGERIMQDLKVYGATQSGGTSGMSSPGYQEEGEQLGSNQQSHYLAAQGDLFKMLIDAPRNLFMASQGNVELVMYTAHEAKGVDDYGQPVYGPDMPGNKAVGRVAKLLGHLLHTESLIVPQPTPTNPKATVKEVRAYFQDHQDPSNAMVVWKAQPRLPAVMRAMPIIKAEMAKKWPGGFIKLEHDQGLRDYLEFMDRMKAIANEHLVKSTAK